MVDRSASRVAAQRKINASIYSAKTETLFLYQKGVDNITDYNIDGLGCDEIKHIIMNFLKNECTDINKAHNLTPEEAEEEKIKYLRNFFDCKAGTGTPPCVGCPTCRFKDEMVDKYFLSLNDYANSKDYLFNKNDVSKFHFKYIILELFAYYVLGYKFSFRRLMQQYNDKTFRKNAKGEMTQRKFNQTSYDPFELAKIVQERELSKWDNSSDISKYFDTVTDPVDKEIMRRIASGDYKTKKALYESLGLTRAQYRTRETRIQKKIAEAELMPNNKANIL